jgi:hypothetical protein
MTSPAVVVKTVISRIWGIAPDDLDVQAAWMATDSSLTIDPGGKSRARAGFVALQFSSALCA